MHVEIKASGAPLTNVLEGSYIPVGAMRRYDPANSDHPSIGVDWDFGVREHGWNWVLERDNILRSGHALAGPAPADLIDPVGPEERKTAVRHVLTESWARIGKPDWLQQAAYQAFAILTMCRALYTLDTGEQATKPQAARWAGDALGQPWRDCIGWALEHRHDFTPHDPDHGLRVHRPCPRACPAPVTPGGQSGHRDQQRHELLGGVAAPWKARSPISSGKLVRSRRANSPLATATRHRSGSRMSTAREAFTCRRQDHWLLACFDLAVLIRRDTAGGAYAYGMLVGEAGGRL
jgi:hypothetical protein